MVSITSPRLSRIGTELSSGSLRIFERLSPGMNSSMMKAPVASLLSRAKPQALTSGIGMSVLSRRSSRAATSLATFSSMCFARVLPSRGKRTIHFSPLEKTTGMQRLYELRIQGSWISQASFSGWNSVTYAGISAFRKLRSI